MNMLPVLPQVLVVDDNDAVREVITGLLGMNGYRTIAAENGVAARSVLTTALPALIVTDLRMPGGDGWDLLAFCRRQHAEVPVLIVSGDVPGQRPEIEQWAAGFIAKPFGPRSFLAAVDQLIFQTALRPMFA